MNRLGPVSLRWRSLLVVALFITLATSACGWLMALPAARSVGVVVGHQPGGDALLWGDGAAWLAETLRLTRETKTSLLAALPWQVAVATAGLFLPWSMLLVLVASGIPAESAGGEPLGWQTYRRLPTLLVCGLSLLAGRVVVGALVLAGWALVPTIFGLPDGRNKDVLQLAVLALGALVWGGLRVAHDLTAVEAASRRERFVTGFGAALACLGHRPFAIYGYYLLTLVLQGFVLYDVALVVGKITVGTPSYAGVVGAVHAVGLFLLVLVRAAWLWVARTLLQRHAFLWAASPPSSENLPTRGQPANPGER